MTSVPAFWGTPQRPPSVSSHSETSKAEWYRNSKEQGRRARATMISHTVGVTRTPSDLFCTGLKQVLPRETNSTAAVATLQISPAFTSQVFPFVDASHLIMLSSTTAPSRAWTHTCSGFCGCTKGNTSLDACSCLLLPCAYLGLHFQPCTCTPPA